MDGYEETFRKFERAGGFVWQWNWASFLFGPLWYLYKGMLPKAVLYFVGALLLGTIIPGVGAIIGWAALGMLGSYDLYLMHRGNTQLYAGANFGSVTQQSLSSDRSTGHSVRSPNDESHTDPPSNRQQDRNAGIDRRRTLEAMRTDGLLTEEEYDQKLASINREDAVRDKVLRLDEALKSGLITQEEYDQKKVALLS